MVQCDWSLKGYMGKSERWGQAKKLPDYPKGNILNNTKLILFHHKPPSTPNFTFLSVGPPFYFQTLKFTFKSASVIVTRREVESFLYSQHSFMHPSLFSLSTHYLSVSSWIDSKLYEMVTFLLFFFLSEFLTSFILPCCWSCLNKEHSGILLPIGKVLFQASILNA